MRVLTDEQAQKLEGTFIYGETKWSIKIDADGDKTIDDLEISQCDHSDDCEFIHGLPWKEHNPIIPKID